MFCVYTKITTTTTKIERKREGERCLTRVKGVSFLIFTNHKIKHFSNPKKKEKKKHDEKKNVVQFQSSFTRRRFEDIIITQPPTRVFSCIIITHPHAYINIIHLYICIPRPLVRI